MEAYQEPAAEARRLVEAESLGDNLDAVLDQMSNVVYQPLEGNEIDVVIEGLEQGLADGGIGIGVPVDYYPGATRGEIFNVYRLAAERNVPIFTHVRDGGIAGIQEALANASITGAPLHIVHINSMALGDIGVALDMVAAAQERGLDITTELYPYTAASTEIETTLFDPGWQDRAAMGSMRQTLDSL